MNLYNILVFSQLLFGLTSILLIALWSRGKQWPLTTSHISESHWEHLSRTWLYSSAWILLQYCSFTSLISIALALCTIITLYAQRSETLKSSLSYRLAKEHLSLFALIWFMQHIAAPYIQKYPSVMMDSSVEGTAAFVGYSLFMALMCIYTHFTSKTPSWKRSAYRAWYYMLLLWILTLYGVEVLLLSTFVLVWFGMLMSRLPKNKKRPSVGCELAKESVWIITFFWIVRSFFFQPFIVPTGSLEPTIFPGDFVLVKQYAYGMRFPVWGWNMYPMGEPQRGDIAVFRFPPKPDVLYVKRVIGVPGDHITYSQDKLTINGVEVTKTLLKPDTTIDHPHAVDRHLEELPGQSHDIYTSDSDPHRSKHWDWHVPKGKYLMLGDNRQGSNDSRFWGYVPESMLVGKVEYIIVSLDQSNAHPSLRADRTLRSVYAPH